MHTTDDDVVPDGRIVANLDVADDGRVRGDPHVVGDHRALVVQVHHLTVARDCSHNNTTERK